MKNVFKIASWVSKVEFMIEQVYQFITGCVKIILLSKWRIRLPDPETNDCIVLGNGPSLNQTILKYSDILSRATLFCVNNFIVSEYCKIYRPRHYVILDPGYFKMKTKQDITLTWSLLKSDVNWEMFLYVPYLYRNDSDVRYFLNHKYVKIVFYNYTVVKTTGSLPFVLYKKKLASPQFYNVLGITIFLAINSGYKKIWLVGADHNWLDGIKVGEDNIPYRLDMHFYDKEDNETRKPIIEPVSGKVLDMYTLYWSITKAFSSYNVIQRYAFYRNISIINASEYSNLDKFKRISLYQYGKL